MTRNTLVGRHELFEVRSLAVVFHLFIFLYLNSTIGYSFLHMILAVRRDVSIILKTIW